MNEQQLSTIIDHLARIAHNTDLLAEELRARKERMARVRDYREKNNDSRLILMTARGILRSRGNEPIKPPELMDALKRQNVAVVGKYPLANLRTIMWRSLDIVLRRDGYALIDPS